MAIIDQLQGVRQLFLDTAPVIYYVEKHPLYYPHVKPVFRLIDQGALRAVTSPVTLAECLIYPYRFQQPTVVESFYEVAVFGANVRFAPTTQLIADHAARLRAQYNVALPDALQLATAIVEACDIFLTNDPALQRVAEVNVLVLDQVEAE